MDINNEPTSCHYYSKAQVQNLKDAWQTMRTIPSIADQANPFSASRFKLGETVKKWFFTSAGHHAALGVIIEVDLIDCGHQDIIAYKIAFPVEDSDVYLMSPNFIAHISPADTTAPEYPYYAWPLEVVKDRTPKIKGSHLSLVK